MRPSHFAKRKYCCGDCYHKHTHKNRNVKDYSGQTINNVKVISQLSDRSSGGAIVYLCECECGNQFKTRLTRLQSGATRSCGCYRRKHSSEAAKQRIGPLHHNWNPELTEKDRIQGRHDQKNVNFRTEVYNRDRHRCVICGATRHLNAHHLDGYNWCKEKRYDPNNGVTLCVDCHQQFHRQYGLGNNTKEQFKEFCNG